MEEQLYKTLETIQNELKRLREENHIIRLEYQKIFYQQEERNFILWTILQKMYPNVKPLERFFILDQNKYLQWIRKYNDIFQVYKSPQKRVNFEVKVTPTYLSKCLIEMMEIKDIKCITSYQIQKMLKIDRFKVSYIIRLIIKNNADFIAISKPHYVPNKNKILKMREVLTL